MSLLNRCENCPVTFIQFENCIVTFADVRNVSQYLLPLQMWELLLLGIAGVDALKLNSETDY